MITFGLIWQDGFDIHGFDDDIDFDNDIDEKFDDYIKDDFDDDFDKKFVDDVSDDFDTKFVIININEVMRKSFLKKHHTVCESSCCHCEDV